MRRLWFVMLCVFLAGGVAQAQTGTITGVVKDDSGALPAANIFIKGTRIGTLSERDGAFRLIGVPTGKHILVMSYIGYAEKEMEVDVATNKVSSVGIVILDPSSLEMDELLVQSTYRHGEQRARAMEKSSLGIMNVLAAESIGKLPDRNAAEAIQRMPGVQIEKDQGEGRFMTVRGAPGQWSSTLLNGSRIPDARSGRRDLPLDIFPAEFIEYVEVTKAMTPDQEADAIGGSVNLLTRTAPEERTLNITMAGGAHNQSKKEMYIGSFFYGDRSQDGRFGIVLSGVVNSRDWGSDNYEVNYNDGEGSVNTLQLRDYLGNRTTYGMNLGSEYQVSDQTKLKVTGIFGQFHDDEIRRRERYQFDAKRYEMGLTNTKYRSELRGGTLGFETVLNDRLELDGKFGYNWSWYGYGGPETVNEDQYGYYAAYFRQSNVEYLGLDANGKKYLGKDSPDPNYQGDFFENIQPHVSPNTPIDPSKIKFYNATSSHYETVGKDFTLQTNAKYRLRDRLNLKFGMKARSQNATIDRANLAWTYGKDAYLTDFPRDAFPVRGGFLTEISSPYNNVIQDFLTVEAATTVMNRTEFEPKLSVSDGSNSSVATAIVDVTEQHYEGYLMGTLETSPDFRVIPGVRLAYTHATGKSNAWLSKERKAIPTEGSDGYLSVLPMVSAIYSPEDRYTIRAAGSRTFTRPNFYDIAPSETVDLDEATISRGNPSIRPTYSWNADFLVSLYPSRLSAISGGVFYKKITDVVARRSIQETLTYEGVTQTFDVSEPFNVDNAKLYGFEVAFNQSLSFLPGVLNGLGLNVNYTYTKSEADVPGVPGAKAPLSNQSPHTFNAQIYYEKSGLSMRFAYNYRAAFIDEYQSEADGERWRDKGVGMDFNASYAVSPQVRIFAEVVNLNNQPLRSYYGNGRTDRPEQVEWYSMRGNVGINWSVF